MSPKTRTASFLITALATIFLLATVSWASDPTSGQAGTSNAPATQPDPNALAHIAGLPAEARVPANCPGFCIDLGSGDGTRAVEIAQKTNFVVFALAKDDADCQKTREALANAHLYGDRATAVTGSLKQLPLPNGYGNLIISGSDINELDLHELFRVLNPNGLAIIGGGKTDPAALKAALDSAGIRDYKISANYAILHGKLPDGIDEWTHFAPRPDNIMTSRETTVRPPFRTQWLLAHPSYDDKAVQHGAVANGRVIFRADVTKPEPDRYYAFDSFNGTQLWTRPVSKAHTNFRYALVDDVFYSTEANIIVALDARTGQKKNEYGGNMGTTWYWLAVQDGVLYCLGKEAAHPTTIEGVVGVSKLFCAYNIKTGELLWKHESDGSVLMQTAALDGAGDVYFCTLEKTATEKFGKGIVASLDGKTGQEKWHHDLGRMAEKYNDCLGAGCYQGNYFVWCCVDDKGVQGTKSFDFKTGQLVKDYPRVRSWGEGYVDQLLFVDGKIYANTAAGREPYRCFDIATGQQLTNPNQTPARDHPGSASANTIFCGGEGFCVYDLLTGKSWSDPFIRYSDFGDPYVAEGMFFHMPTVCHCPHAFGAPMALAPAGLNWTPPEADQDMPSRLVKGPASESPLLDDAKDQWTHYRGNPGHTGESAFAPALPLKAAWQQKLNGQLTPPSIGGGLAYTASRTGEVWGLDAATGQVQWKFLCGAGVRVTPAYGRGRLLFGSYDGWVYCLEAKTGQLAWRFRAAPQQRYINTEGQMSSLWPSAAGVIIDGDTVYCAAGLQSFDGTYLYSLDLQSGAVKWAKRIGDLETKGAPQGIMALTGDTLVVPVFSLMQTLAYSKNDGQLINWYEKRRPFWLFGSEAIADGDVYFLGGARHGNDDHYSRPAAFTLMDMKTGWTYGPDVSFKPPKAIAPVCVAPVLGRQTIIGDGVGFDRGKLEEALRNDPATANESRGWTLQLWPEGANASTDSLALAGGVMLAAGILSDGNSQLVAFDPKPDGKELSRVNIPGNALRNSLAVSNGRVYLITSDSTLHCLAKD